MTKRPKLVGLHIALLVLSTPPFEFLMRIWHFARRWNESGVIQLRHDVFVPSDGSSISTMLDIERALDRW